MAKRNGVEFTFDDNALYRREAFRSGAVDADQVLKEYSRLRQVALKRLKRMEGTKYEESQTYLRNVGMYPSISEIAEKKMQGVDKLTPEARKNLLALHVSRRLDDLERFLSAKTGSIRGMQKVEKQLLNTLHERGASFVTKDNIHAFGDFMQHAKKIYESREYDSERTLEVFSIAEKRKLNLQEIQDDFEFWYENSEKLSKMAKNRNAKYKTVDDYRKALTDRKKR